MRSRTAITLLILGMGQAIHAQEPHRPRAGAAVQRHAPRAGAGIEVLPAPAVEALRPLTLAELERVALQNNPTLAAAQAGIEASEAARVQAGLYPNPVVGYNAMEIGHEATAGQQGTFVSQQFVTAGKLRAGRAVAGMEVQTARFELDAQVQRVLNDVRIRFYDALVAQRRMELARELARIGKEQVHSSQRLLEAGQISEVNLLQAEIEAESAHIERDNAANELVESRRRLEAVVGVHSLGQTPLSGELDENLPQHDWQQCYERVLAQSPELGAALAGVERARLAAQRARLQRIPDIHVMASVLHDNATSDDVTNLQVGVPLPIFDANQGNIRRAEAEWIAAQNNLRRVELDLQDRLAVVFRRYENARQQTARYRQQILPRAHRSLELVGDGYARGQVDYLTLITAQRTFVQVNLAYLAALRELQETAVIMEGQLLSGGLTGR